MPAVLNLLQGLLETLLSKVELPLVGEHHGMAGQGVGDTLAGSRFWVDTRGVHGLLKKTQCGVIVSLRCQRLPQRGVDVVLLCMEAQLPGQGKGLLTAKNGLAGSAEGVLHAAQPIEAGCLHGKVLLAFGPLPCSLQQGHLLDRRIEHTTQSELLQQLASLLQLRRVARQLLQRFQRLPVEMLGAVLCGCTHGLVSGQLGMVGRLLVHASGPEVVGQEFHAVGLGACACASIEVTTGV